MVETAITVIAASIIYALVHYWAKRKRAAPEKFEPKKFARAVIIGVVVGATAWQMGTEVTFSNFESVASAIGAVGVADQLVKVIWRYAQQLR